MQGQRGRQSDGCHGQAHDERPGKCQTPVFRWWAYRRRPGRQLRNPIPRLIGCDARDRGARLFPCIALTALLLDKHPATATATTIVKHAATPGGSRQAGRHLPPRACRQKKTPPSSLFHRAVSARPAATRKPVSVIIGYCDHLPYHRCSAWSVRPAIVPCLARKYQKVPHYPVSAHPVGRRKIFSSPHM